MFQKHRMEILAYILIIMLGVALFSHFEAFEELYEFTRNHEEYELDEFIMIIPLLFLCMALFSMKRLSELKKRKAAYETMREELAEACSMLGDMARYKEEFILKACEELQAPLDNTLDTLHAMSTCDQCKNVDTLTEIHATLENLHRAVGSTPLALQSGEATTASGELSVSKLLESVRLMAQAQADMKGLALHFIREDAHERYRCNKSYLRLVLMTIVDNAIKHTENGRICVYTTYAGNDVKQLLITIADTGAGISTEQLKSVFAFKGGHCLPNNLNECFGINLSLAMLLIQRAGGTLSVSSDVGQGSDFTISLPAEPL